MPDAIDIHLKLGTTHARIIEKLIKKMGMDRTAIIRLAIYRLGVEEGIQDAPREAK